MPVELSTCLQLNFPSVLTETELENPLPIVENYYTAIDLWSLRQFLFNIFTVAMCATDETLGVEGPMDRDNYVNNYRELLQFLEAYFWLNRDKRDERLATILKRNAAKD